MKIIKITLLTIAIIVSVNTAHPVFSAETSSAVKQQRFNGVVKWFNDAKGYGFITTEKGEDLFVHFRSIQGTGFKTLKERQKVTYKIVQGQKGQQADEVQPL